MAITDCYSGQNFFSQSWYRVGGLKPRLRKHIQVHRQMFRDVEWFVLQDHSTGRFHRISSEAYFIVGLMDGLRTMDDIWGIASDHLRDAMLPQEEVISLLAQLHQFDAIQSDLPPDMQNLSERSLKARQMKLLTYLASPLSLKFPLIDPDRFLNRTIPLVRPFLNWGGFLAWLAVVAYGVVLTGIHWKELTSNISDRVLSLENLLLLSLIYPLIMVLHEFGHAYVVKRWGGEVHEMGVMLLVFIPVPYVDATASYSFGSKYRRMLVGAAGIMVEVFLAALSVIFWVDIPPGTMRAIAYNIMIIGGVSTILVNGNPLIKYDAYYILSDFLEIPNLASRSGQYIAYFIKRCILRIGEATTDVRNAGEALWLAGYGVLSFAYRVFIMLSIALFIAGKFFFIGVIIASWSLFSFILTPVFRLIRHVQVDPLMQRYRIRALVAGLGFAAFVLFIVAFVQVPSFTVVEGVVLVPEEAQVNAGAEGFVTRIVTRPESRIKRGDVLVICEAPKLEKELHVSEANLREVEARYSLSRATDRTAMGILQEEMAKIHAELRRARERKTGLVLRSPADGIYMLPQAEDYPGRYVKKGAPLGYVVDFSKSVVRIVVDQDDVDQIRSRTLKVEGRLASAISSVVPAKVVREVPAASSDLPSMALSTDGGGNIALDPNEKNDANPKAFKKNFLVDVTLVHTPLTRIGERAFIRFVHPPETLAEKWCRGLRRLLIYKFNL